MIRVLFVELPAYFDPSIPFVRGKFECLSTELHGDIFTRLTRRELRGVSLGQFTVRGFYLPSWLARFGPLRYALYALSAFIVAVYSHYLRARYDVVHAWDPHATGPIALAIGRVTGARIIIEVNGNYGSSEDWEIGSGGMWARLKYMYSQVVIPRVLNRADAIKILYPEQLEPFQRRLRSGKRVWCFHDFVPIRLCERGAPEEPYVLFIGTPWYRKGVDILIQAFNHICARFPDIHLKLVGYFPGREQLERLSAGNDRIHFCGPLPHEQAMRMMARCTAFVLPSRSEAMGRVLLEAMASRKPIVASRVDGIPTYVTDGETGLLFESENVEELAEKLAALLGDRAMARRLADRGFPYVHSRLSEDAYLERFVDMIRALRVPPTHTADEAARPTGRP